MGTQYPNKISALVELKSKLAEHQKLHKIEDILDDAMLIGFLNGKKYNVNDSLKCLEQFVYIRTEKYPSFSMKYLIPSTLPMLDVQCIRTLKYMDKGCRRIGVGQISLWDPSKNNVHELLAENVLHLDESIRNYMTHSEGNEFIMIIDMAGFCVQHFRNATPSRIVQYFDFFLNNAPVRVVAIHLLNLSKMGNIVVSVCKRFMKEKIRKRLFIHDDFASLHDHLPATALPVSLGGHLSDEDAFENEFVPGIRNQERFYTRMAELAMVS
ncbi:alpha-tocopherol transfer protein-like [Folsomia candida]|uniref:alpha-tocopherol transfer protein-like n=1 Tax=Folsomia candida TaxID=158441 RepID=UPI000B901377|nr:alpha-tocopherol transfer protein-like [Folsomia candida]